MPRDHDDELKREIQTHLELETEERVADGMSEADARYAARRAFGSVTRTQEDVRAVWTRRWINEIVQGVRYGLRTLRKAPGFTTVAVLTLAIGIGATTAIFSVVNGILIKPLPFAQSDRLIALIHQAAGANQYEMAASPAIYFTYRDNNQTFESVALWYSTTASVTGSGHPEEVRKLQSTHELLPLLRVQPLFGRTFSEADDRPGSPRTVILSHGFWRRRFGGAPTVLGQTMVVDGAPHEIIGVLPPEFRFLQEADILTPAQPDRAHAFVPSTGERGIARLKDGVTLAQASADVARMIPILIDSFPTIPGLTRQAVVNMRIGPNLRSLKDDIIGDLDDVLWVLMATIGMLFLVACANVANLQLARSEARRQELAIRVALGAGWRRIAANLLLESTVLGLVGGVAGLALAAATLPLLLSIAAQELPTMLDITIDPTVLAFTLAISIGSGLVFGLIPVVKYARPQVAAMLSGAGRGHTLSRERHRARYALVVVQVALALVLLVASGLMIRTFQSLRDVNPGFIEPEHIQSLHLEISEDAVPEFDRVVRMQNAICDRLSTIGGVKSVAFSTRGLPLIARGPTGPFWREDKPGGAPVEMEFRYTSPGLFRTLGTPLVAGRDFQWTEYYGNTRHVAIVSETMARREWGSPAAAIGKRMRRSEKGPWLEVIGVGGDIRHRGVDKPAPDTVYLTSSEPLAPYMSRAAFFFVRSDRAGTAEFIDEIQRAIWSENGALPLGSVQTMGEVYQRSTARTALSLALISIAGAMTLALGLVGIYGAISYSLTQRTREIGVRMALGAGNAGLKRMVLRQVLLPVAIGVAVGLGAAALLARLMESLLFGVGARDVTTYVTVSAIFVMTAALAAYLPARRVTRIDPIKVLREDLFA